MAHFITKPIKDHDPDSEIKTAESLSKLSNDWHIIHSVSWQGERDNRQGDGEADFVIASAQVGVICIEVKGGGVHLEDGKWKTVNRFGKTISIKDPFRQVTASKSKLYNFFQSELNLNIPTMHAVVFPDITITDSLSLSAPREIMLDREDLINISDSIGRVIRHWKNRRILTSKELKSVLSSLAPTISIRRTLADNAHDANVELFKLTYNQIRALQKLSRAR